MCFINCILYLDLGLLIVDTSDSANDLVDGGNQHLPKSHWLIFHSLNETSISLKCIFS